MEQPHAGIPGTVFSDDAQKPITLPYCNSFNSSTNEAFAKVIK
jgi:hypothetical protein